MLYRDGCCIAQDGKMSHHDGRCCKFLQHRAANYERAYSTCRIVPEMHAVLTDLKVEIFQLFCVLYCYYFDNSKALTKKSFILWKIRPEGISHEIFNGQRHLIPNISAVNAFIPRKTRFWSYYEHFCRYLFYFSQNIIGWLSSIYHSASILPFHGYKIFLFR